MLPDAPVFAENVRASARAPAPLGVPPCPRPAARPAAESRTTAQSASFRWGAGACALAGGGSVQRPVVGQVADCIGIRLKLVRQHRDVHVARDVTLDRTSGTHKLVLVPLER